VVITMTTEVISLVQMFKYIVNKHFLYVCIYYFEQAKFLMKSFNFKRWESQVDGVKVSQTKVTKPMIKR